MAQRRLLKDTVSDPVVKRKPAVNRRKNPKPNQGNAAAKIVLSLLLGFAGGLLTGRWLKI